MKARLQKMLTSLEAELAKAEDFQDSENEKTVDRYTEVAESIQVAIDALEEAIACWD